MAGAAAFKQGSLNLAKQDHLVLVQCFLTIQLGNIFFNAAFPQWILAWLLLGA